MKHCHNTACLRRWCSSNKFEKVKPHYYAGVRFEPRWTHVNTLINCCLCSGVHSLKKSERVEPLVKHSHILKHSYRALRCGVFESFEPRQTHVKHSHQTFCLLCGVAQRSSNESNHIEHMWNRNSFVRVFHMCSTWFDSFELLTLEFNLFELLKHHRV